MVPQQVLTWTVPVTLVDEGVPQVLLTVMEYAQGPLVPAGGDALMVNCLLEPADISPRLVVLTVSQVGPEALVMVTP